MERFTNNSTTLIYVTVEHLKIIASHRRNQLALAAWEPAQHLKNCLTLKHLAVVEGKSLQIPRLGFILISLVLFIFIFLRCLSHYCLKVFVHLCCLRLAPYRT